MSAVELLSRSVGASLREVGARAASFQKSALERKDL